MRRLIADIGGTNARFALVGEDGLPTGIRTLRVADHRGLVEAASAYLDGHRVDEAVIAVATIFVRYIDNLNKRQGKVEV